MKETFLIFSNFYWINTLLSFERNRYALLHELDEVCDVDLWIGGRHKLRFPIRLPASRLLF